MTGREVLHSTVPPVGSDGDIVDICSWGATVHTGRCARRYAGKFRAMKEWVGAPLNEGRKSENVLTRQFEARRSSCDGIHSRSPARSLCLRHRAKARHIGCDATLSGRVLQNHSLTSIAYSNSRTEYRRHRLSGSLNSDDSPGDETSTETQAKITETTNTSLTQTGRPNTTGTTIVKQDCCAAFSR